MALDWGWGLAEATFFFLVPDVYLTFVALRLIARARTQLEARGLVAMLQGPLQGMPYKIYAVQWGILHGSWGSFLLVSIPARAGRFLLSVLVPFALRRFVRPWALACAWTAFYAYYFWTFGW